MSALDTVERTAAEQTADPDPLVHMYCGWHETVIGSTAACGSRKVSPDYRDFDAASCVVCADLGRTGWTCADCGFHHRGIPS